MTRPLVFSVMAAAFISLAWGTNDAEARHRRYRNRCCGNAGWVQPVSYHGGCHQTAFNGCQTGGCQPTYGTVSAGGCTTGGCMPSTGVVTPVQDQIPNHGNTAPPPPSEAAPPPQPGT